jgi:hypothetical protein
MNQPCAESNQAALERVAKFVEEENIDCDFSRRSAYTFTESEQGLKQIEEEVAAALRLDSRLFCQGNCFTLSNCWSSPI